MNEEDLSNRCVFAKIKHICGVRAISEERDCPFRCQLTPVLMVCAGRSEDKEQCPFWK